MFEAQVLPVVTEAAQQAFQGYRDRDERIQSALVVAFLGYRSLQRRGKEVDPSSIAFYAIHHVRGGRDGGAMATAKDVLSFRAQRAGGFTVGSLEEGQAATLSLDPAPQAILNLDLPGFRELLTDKQRTIAEMALQGCSTSEIAKAVGVTLGAVSQQRRKIVEKWDSYQGAAHGAA